MSADRFFTTEPLGNGISWWLSSKESTCNAGAASGAVGSISRLGRSPGEGNGNPLHYSYLENLMHRGAWWATNICKVKTLNLFGFSSDVRLYLFVLSDNEYFFPHLFVIYIFLKSAAVSCPFVWKYLSFSHCL